MVMSKGTIIEWNKIPINALVTGLFRMQYIHDISLHRSYNPFTIYILKKSLENIEKEAQINEPVRHYLLCKYGCENFPVRRV